MNKKIKAIIPAQKVNMGGHLLDQPLPVDGLDYVDPFLLIHHWKNELLGGQKVQEEGVGPHPHRGFSPVTFIFKGAVNHQDSLGNNALVSEGGTQWMFAGRGITHSERFPKELVENGGELEFIQFWVNAPSEEKMKPAFYKPISKEDTPLIEGEKSKIWVVAGELNGIKGAAPTNTPQTLLRGIVEKGGKIDIPIPETYNTILYLLDGEGITNEEEVIGKDMIVYEQESGNITYEATQETRFIVLSGEPIKEKVASYGPFVMNSQTEVMEALRDAQSGKMGVLIEEFE